jgi:cytoskeletal protein CcmA (bactofilin family)
MPTQKASSASGGAPMSLHEAAAHPRKWLSGQEESPMATRPSGWRRVEPEIRDAEREPTATPEQAAPATDRTTTFIFPECQLEGRLVLKDSIRIECEFRGSLESAQTVTIGEQAEIEAGVEARTVIVHGAVVGDVRGTREVVLHATARVQGSVETPSLVIERGAVFNGQTRVYRPEQALRTRRALERDASRPGPVAART